MDNVLAVQVPEAVDVLGEHRAYGGRVREELVKAAIIAPHMGISAIVPVLLIVGKPASCIFDTHLPSISSYFGGDMGT